MPQVNVYVFNQKKTAEFNGIVSALKAADIGNNNLNENFSTMIEQEDQNKNLHIYARQENFPKAYDVLHAIINNKDLVQQNLQHASPEFIAAGIIAYANGVSFDVGHSTFMVTGRGAFNTINETIRHLEFFGKVGEVPEDKKHSTNVLKQAKQTFTSLFK